MFVPWDEYACGSPDGEVGVIWVFDGLCVAVAFGTIFDFPVRPPDVCFEVVSVTSKAMDEDVIEVAVFHSGLSS